MLELFGKCMAKATMPSQSKVSVNYYFPSEAVSFSL
jgi:hypothetical protein